MTDRRDRSVLAGSFWLADDDERRVHGRLNLAEGASPRLELDQLVTPALVEIDRQEQPEGTRTLVFAEDGPAHESLVVHGILDDGSLVTLEEAFTAGRKHTRGGRDQQVLQARSAVLGGHVGGRDELYTHMRLRLRHLDAWAALPGLALENDPRQRRATLAFRGSEPSPVSLQDGGRLDLEQEPEIEFSQVRGGRIGSVVWLRAIDLPPMTADDLNRRFVTPLSSLLTLATDTDCPPVAVEVATASDQPWLTMHHSGLRAPAEEVRPTHRQLLPLAILGLDRGATWLNAVEHLGPLPPVVAAAVAGPGRTLETQLLELTTVAEGLHQRVFPGSCSFRQRLHKLAEYVEPAMPGITGQTNCWKQHVTAIRHEFAHRDYGFLETARIDELLAVLQSLRWLLTGLLLLRTGLPPAELAARVNGHQPYILFRQQAHEWLPRVFQAPTDQ